MKKFLCVLLTFLMIFSLTACEKKTISSIEEPSVSENTVETVSGNVEEEKPETEALEEKPEEEPEEEIVYPEASLKELFAEHGIKCGTCMNTRMYTRDVLVDILNTQFNSGTMENEMKPDAILNREKSIEAGEPVVELKSDAKQILKFAKDNGMSMRGHTLVWYSQTPVWIFHEDFDGTKPLVTREVMLDRMEKYIKNVFAMLEESGYIDLFYAYDVVNEAVLDNGTLRDNTWKKIIGDDYIWYAFYFADKYAPESIDLYYNDFNEQFKYNGTLELVDTLKDSDGRYLIDGIGLQAHLYTNDSITSYFRALDEYGKTGLKVELTELDVCLGSYQVKAKNTDANLDTQGRWYYDLINGIFERKDAGTLNIDAITFWGVVDELSWRNTQYPLLYSITGKPKPAYFGAAQIKEFAGFNE